MNKAVLETSQTPTMKCQGRLTPHCINFNLKKKWNKKISDPKCSIFLSTSTQTASRSKVPPIQMCGCILENTQLKQKRERKSIIQTKRLTVQPIFLPSTSPIFMQSLKQKVMTVKKNDIYPLIVKHTSENRHIWLGERTETIQPKGVWVNSWPRWVRDFMTPFLGHRIPQSSRKSMFFFWLCRRLARCLLEIICFPHTLCSNHASRSQHGCQKRQPQDRLGSIFCWVSFSPCQSDHHSAARTLVLAQGRGWCEWGNEQGWVCFLQRLYI